MFQYMDSNYCVLEDTFITWSGKESQLRVPTVFNGRAIKKIGAGAFAKCNTLREVYIGEGYEEIGEGAFEQCTNLEKVFIPDTVKKINAKAFYKCERLQVVRMSQRLEDISTYVFMDCYALKEIHLPSTIKTMPPAMAPVFPDGTICNVYVHFKTDVDSYKELSKKKLALSTGKLLFTDTIDEVEWLSTLKYFNLPNHIDESMHAIFLVDQPSIDLSPDMRRTVFCWEGVPDMSKEDTVVKKLIAEDSSSYVNAEDERQWVANYIREIGNLPRSFSDAKNELCFCVLQQVDTSLDGYIVEGVIKIYRAFGFFLSVHKILYKHKFYYLYSRNYLFGNKMAKPDRVGNGDPVYYRNDMAIYGDEGLISDRKMSEEIYARYKLFSIL